MPLVIVLHGGRGNYGRLSAYEWDQLAEHERFLLVTPDAWEGYWNDGRDDLRADSVREGVDDVGFIRRLIEITSDQYPVNPNRIYVAGISNGAMMSARVACDLSRTVAAVGLVAGSMGRETAVNCTPSRPVSVVNLSGTEDPIVPFGGGEISAFGRYRGHVIGAAATAEFWGKRDNCEQASVATVPDRDDGDGSTITISRRSECTARTAVDLYIVRGGGHTWPGHAPRIFSRRVGRTNLDVHATAVLWTFFDSHPRRGANRR